MDHSCDDHRLERTSNRSLKQICIGLGVNRIDSGLAVRVAAVGGLRKNSTALITIISQSSRKNNQTPIKLFLASSSVCEAKRYTATLTWTMIRSPFQRHHMLVSHVSIGIEKIALYQIFVFPILLFQSRLMFARRTDEEEERHIRRLLAPGLSDHISLQVILRRGVYQHQQQRLRTVARLVVDCEPEVLYVYQREFVTERKFVQQVRLRCWRHVPWLDQQVTRARYTVAVRLRWARAVDVKPKREAPGQCQGDHENQSAWRRTGGMQQPLIQHTNRSLTSYRSEAGWKRRKR